MNRKNFVLITFIFAALLVPILTYGQNSETTTGTYATDPNQTATASTASDFPPDYVPISAPPNKLAPSNHPSVLKWISKRLKKGWRSVSGFIEKRLNFVFSIRKNNALPGPENSTEVFGLRVKYNTIRGHTLTGTPNIEGVAAINPAVSPLKLGQIVCTTECGCLLIADAGSGNRAGDLEIVGSCGKKNRDKVINVYIPGDEWLFSVSGNYALPQ